VGLLPSYLGGTFKSLPKGAAIPRTRALSVAFGPFLSIEALQELTAGLSHQEGWRLIAALTQRIVENLRDGITIRLDLVSARAGWNGEPGSGYLPRPLERASRPGPGAPSGGGLKRACDLPFVYGSPAIP